MSLLPPKIHPSWNLFLNEINTELKRIELEIGDSFFPEKENMLRFLSLDLNKLKCVIVGMEPYASHFEKDGIIYPEATGRSFEVRSLKEKNWQDKFKQSSLRNILKTIIYNHTGTQYSMQEIRKMLENKDIFVAEPKKWFENLEEQGVLFLNASLSVIPDKVGSHTKIWENFMTQFIQYITENNSEIYWLLWGNDAKSRILPFVEESQVICSCHPRLNEFICQNCFQYLPEINWMGV